MFKRIATFALCSVLAVTAFGAGMTPALAAKSDRIQYGDYQKKYEAYGSSDKILLLDATSLLEVKGEQGEKGASLTKKGDYVSFLFEVEADVWYCPKITYFAVEGNGSDIEATLMVDGDVPYRELENFTLTRLWKNAVDTFQKDDYGHEYSPEQVEVFESQSCYLSDSDGFITENLCLALSKGTHQLTFQLINEKLCVERIELLPVHPLPSHEKYAADKNGNNYEGENIVIEGESASYKSSKMYLPLSNRDEVSLSPSDPYRKLNNYIGGSNWNHHGGTIGWEIEVPSDGFYNIGFHFHQTYLQESSSYRSLKIDGEVPFKEAAALSFPYRSGWQFKNLDDGKGNELPVYLTAGKHTLSLSVTLGELADFSEELKAVTGVMGQIYRDIVKITGESPDANRDYNLFTALPDLESQLGEIRNQLEKLIEESENISGAKGGSNAQILKKAKIIIDQMLAKKYQAQTKLSAFYDNYSSLCSWLYEMQNMALDIDTIVLSAPKNHYSGEKVGFFESLSFTFKRLLSSFASDYMKTTKYENEITLWSNWGRDQLNILQNLIANDFTPKTGIKVNLKITDASLVQAGLSGDGPDVEINTARTNPLNYGMRGILVDLTQFKDYDEVAVRFSKTATVPYQYNGAVYGLPNTETFEMMFIRNDIFEDLGLSVPETWEDFINASKVIALNNMNCGMGAPLSVFLSQMNVDLYKPDHSATNLLSTEAINATNFWLDFYTKYGFPITYSFFNRFRTGLMPMGLVPYTEYATLKAAAPEINGQWSMVCMPGVKQEDGTVNHSVSGGGTASVILEWSKHKDQAWEFMKWWTSEDIQYRFGVNCEAVLGVSGRYPTANLNALYRLGWDEDTLSELKKQIDCLNQFPEVPGSYYVARSIQQVQWNVVNNGENVEDMLEKWVPEADDEIRRKTEEYATN